MMLDLFDGKLSLSDILVTEIPVLTQLRDSKVRFNAARSKMNK